MKQSVSNLQLAFHLYGAGQMIATFYYHRKYVYEISGAEDFAGSYKFLTFLNIVVQMCFFMFATFLDVMQLCGNKMPKMNKLKDCYLASVAFPYTALVFSTFWLIYSVDRELIYPESLDEYIPKFVNHLMHTTVAITGGEFAISTHSYPSRKFGIIFSVFTGLSYFAWISYVKSVTGYWPYPFMRMLGVGSFSIFLLIILIFVTSFYILGEKLHSEPKSKSRKKFQ